MLVRTSSVFMSGQTRAGVELITPNNSPGCGTHECNGSRSKASAPMLEASTPLQACPGRYQSPAPPYHCPSFCMNTHWFPSTSVPGSPKKKVEGDSKPELPFNPALLKKVDELELSVRSVNSLKNSNIRTLGDLVRQTEAQPVLVECFDPKTNTWAAGPRLPDGMGADDAPGAMLPNGHFVFLADFYLFNGPTHLFDFDYKTNKLTDLTADLPQELQDLFAQLPAEADCRRTGARQQPVRESLAQT